MVQDKPVNSIQSTLPTSFEPFSQEPIQFVNEHGEWVAPFTLEIPKNELQGFYRDMVASRMLDERWQKLQRMGKSSFIAESRGHEGAQIGAARALKAGFDWVVPYYRDTGMVYTLGISALELLAQFCGSSLDTNKARQMPCHPTSKTLNVFTVISSIAAQIPPAVGIAMSINYKKTGQAVLTSFGDGATSEGDWHAAVNLAGVQSAPIVFLCQNNRYAVSVPANKQTASVNIAIKAQSYGMNGYFVDGMDVLASHFVIKQALEEARKGEPALVEAVVDRFGPHSSSDSDLNYRTKEEKDIWLKRDPIKRLQLYMQNLGIWDDAWEEHIKAEIDKELTEAVRAIDNAPPVAIETLFEDVFAELTPQFLAQRDEYSL